MGTRTNTKAKMRVVETVPDIGNLEVGEFVYDSTNDKIALRLITGMVYFSKD
jgi:hypothetical protein